MVEITTFEHNGANGYPILNQILGYFKSIIHEQTVLGRTPKPTIMKIIPILEDIKQTLPLLLLDCSNEITVDEAK